MRPSHAVTEARSFRGFTLVELVVGMALTTLVVIMVARAVEIYRPALSQLKGHERGDLGDVLSGAFLHDTLRSSGVAGLPGSFFIPCPGGQCNGTAVALRRSAISGFILNGAGTNTVDFRPSQPAATGVSAPLGEIRTISLFTIDGEFRGMVGSFQQLSCDTPFACRLSGTSNIVPSDAQLVEINVEHLLLACEGSSLQLYRTEVAGDPFAFNPTFWDPGAPVPVAEGLLSCSVNYVLLDADEKVVNTAASLYDDGRVVRAAKIAYERRKSLLGTATERQELAIVRTMD